MKIALISDMHGNLAAFEAVLGVIAAEQIEQIVCLGDAANFGPQPHEVLVRLRELGCPVVMGNADAELFGTAPDGFDEDEERFTDIHQWCLAQLDERDLAYVRSFVPTVRVNLGAAGSLLCCHGSPRSFNDIIYSTTPESELDPMMTDVAEVIAGGHTHVRMLRHWQGRVVLNPGSVGRAYQHFPDGSRRVPPWAEFAILTAEDERVSIDFRSVPYDRAATLAVMRDRQMPHLAWWTKEWN